MAIRRVQFGARIPTSGPASTAARVKKATSEAESLGYDSVFDTDHIHNSHERHQQYPVGMGDIKDSSSTPDPNQFETLTTFSYLAGMTKSIKFGVGVMPLLLRDPLVTAKEVATLANLSDGRFIFGVGVSNVSDKLEFKAAGKLFPSYETRYRMLDEYISAMKEIWTKPKASFHGEFLKFDDLTIYPKPPRGHVPIWIGSQTLSGGKAKPAVRFALKHADGWIMGFLMMPNDLRKMVDDYKQTAREEGADISKFDWCFQLRLSIAQTDGEALQNCSWIASSQPDVWRYWGLMWQRKEAPVEAVRKASVGTPSKIIKDVEQFIDAGTTHFDLWFMYPRYEELLRQMRLFAKEVLPSFT